MADTPNLELPFIEASQAQKHVTHNEALRALDAIVQLGVETAGLAAPPAAPADGSRYIVAAGATGAWAGRDGTIAAFQDGAWAFFAPNEGWLAWIADEAMIHIFDGSTWIPYASGLTSVNPIALVGVNTTADATNRLAVKSDAVLFSHDDVNPGSGSIRHTLNKAASGASATVLFQDAWSGRAEIGLAGDDDFHVKVSPDGSGWHQGITVDRTDGRAAFPAGVKHAASGATANLLIQTPGGNNEVTAWRFDAARSGLPRTAVISAVSGDKITLTETRAREFFTNRMEGVSYVRIWNQSKSPEQAAWLRKGTAASTTELSSDLWVTNAADVSGWSSGDTIRLGDGTHGNANAATVDISPMMQNRLGAVFLQSGTAFSVTASTDGTSGANCAVSPVNGAAFVSAYTPKDGSLTQATGFVGATEPSPISNSRTFIVREQVTAGTSVLAVGAVNITGLYV